MNLKPAVQTAKHAKYAKGKGVECIRKFTRWENLSPFCFRVDRVFRGSICFSKIKRYAMSIHVQPRRLIEQPWRLTVHIQARRVNLCAERHMETDFLVTRLLSDIREIFHCTYKLGIVSDLKWQQP